MMSESMDRQEYRKFRFKDIGSRRKVVHLRTQQDIDWLLNLANDQQSDIDQQAARIAELEAEVARLRTIEGHYSHLMSLARAVTENHQPGESVDLGNLAHYVYHEDKPELVEQER